MIAEDVSLLSDEDIYLFNEGSHFRLYQKLGAHPITVEGEAGTYFAVWAPNAERVSVIGDFNGWERDRHSLQPRAEAGIWEGFIPGVSSGAHYKYRVVSRHREYAADKADPFGFHHETSPRTGSIVWDMAYDWGDEAWMQDRGERFARDAPVSVYELHLGSWRRNPDDPESFLSYRQLAPLLVEHMKRTGFTHVEFLPPMEHPFYGSWGYQTTGYFAPSSRFGTPQDFMFLVDRLHQEGFGVLVDWVPSHFPTDEHGLGYFDGTHLYEHEDRREGFHPDWNSYIFNYGRDEVRSFLISSALHWLDTYHVDGIRVDAVASMLYRDYSREAGDWIPNKYGGRENLEAIDFLRRLNSEAYRSFPDIQMIAEESTAWPMVSRPTWLGGLGFGMKWDMGWMHDTLQFISRDPVHRSYHHHDLTFRMVYAFTESFMLPLSHDEVVHGKGSLLGKMPGDDWQRFANLRLLYGYMFAQPGKKLLFMGSEFGQEREWAHDGSLDWHLLEGDRKDFHEGIIRWISDLNRVYREQGALHTLDFDHAGFEWIDANDSTHSVLSFLRKGTDGEEMAVVFNFTPTPHDSYRLGVSTAGTWKEALNSDAEAYGGSGRGNFGAVASSPTPHHGRPHSLLLSIPPLSALFFEGPRAETPEKAATLERKVRAGGRKKGPEGGP